MLPQWEDNREANITRHNEMKITSVRWINVELRVPDIGK